VEWFSAEARELKFEKVCARGVALRQP